MQRHNSYPSPYAFAGPPSVRHSGPMNSANSPSANPDEDWTKISDLAERRRIQNRIAQRNYRKKLKRRLEDLERRADSSSTSPEQNPAELSGQARQQQPGEAGRKKKAAKPGINPPKRSPVPPPAPSFARREGQAGGVFQHQQQRGLSASPPPPSFHYPSYSVADPPPPNHAPYPQHAPFHSLPAPYPDYSNQPLYLPPPLPMTRPQLHAHDGGPPKMSDPHFGDDDMMGHFGMNYPPVGSMEGSTSQSYVDSPSTAYASSLSFSQSYLSDDPRTGQSMNGPINPMAMSIGRPLLRC